MPNGRETWSRFVTLSMNKYAVAELFHPVTDGRPGAFGTRASLRSSRRRLLLKNGVTLNPILLIR